MPFQLLNLDGVANYLHLTPADIEQRVKNREIPFEKRGDRIVFRKSEIDAWASQRILGLPGQRLADYHRSPPAKPGKSCRKKPSCRKCSSREPSPRP